MHAVKSCRVVFFNQIEIGVLGVRVAKTGVILFDESNPAPVDMENIPFS